jgi:hypothetical protein
MLSWDLINYQSGTENNITDIFAKPLVKYIFERLVKYKFEKLHNLLLGW